MFSPFLGYTTQSLLFHEQTLPGNSKQIVSQKREEATGEVDFEAETETVDAVDIVAVETVVNGTEETMTVEAEVVDIEAVETKAADEVNGTVETEKAFTVVVDTVRGQA